MDERGKVGAGERVQLGRFYDSSDMKKCSCSEGNEKLRDLRGGTW